MRTRILPLLLLLVSLFSCNSSSKQDAQGTPLIYDFHPGRANVNPGTSTLLLANFVGGTATIDQGIGAVTSGVPVPVSPSTTTVYQLTVKGATGDPAVATTTITVGPLSVDITPAQITLPLGQSQAFSANITGLADRRVQWSAQGGTIDAQGVFTAGRTPGAYLISAQSLAEPTLCAKAFVTVLGAPIVVTVNPPAPILTTGHTLAFTALVTGSANGAVTWTTSAGSITAGGVFTAPATTGSVMVTATSTADATRSASITVNVVAAPSATSLLPAKGTVTAGTATAVTPTFANGTATIGTTGPGSSNLAAAATSGTAVSTGVLAVNTTCTLTVTNLAGDTATASTAITTVPAATASLAPSSAAPLRGAANVTITPTFTGGTAVVGTSQGASNVSASATSNVAIGVQATGFTTATTYWMRVTNAAGDFVDASTTITPQTVGVAALSPAAPTVSVSTSTTFTTTVTGGFLGTVTWSGTGGTWAGNRWTAPPIAGTYTITATSTDDITKTATTSVTVVDLPVITTFTLKQVGFSSPTWALDATYSGGTGVVDQGVGTLASGVQLNVGLTHADLYTLTVTNLAGASVTQTASAVAIVVDSGSTGSVLPGRTYTPLAHVNGATNTTISYAASSGSVTSGGVFTPPMADGAYTLTLTAQADPSVKSIVTVNVYPLVMPQSQTIAPNASFTFRAPVLGLANSGVTWSLSSASLGTISSQGVFTSNGTTGSVTVTAALAADATVKGTANLTIQPGFAYTNTFTAITGPSAITTLRTQHALTRLPIEYILASGGLNGGIPTAILETFYQSTWSTKAASLITARSRHTATLLPTGLVLIAGGRDAAGNPLASAELYDMNFDTIAAVPGSLLAAREDHTATLLQNGKVLFTGGRGASGTLASAELYDPATNAFTPAATAMADPRVGHSAVTLLDGRVLVAGGSKDGTDFNLSLSADLFDPTTAAFSPANGVLPYGRRNMGAALAPSGFVTLLGGVFTPSVPLVNSGGQKFDPAAASNAFTNFTSLTAPMSRGRNRPLFTLLADGNMLALGGSTDLGSAPDQNGITNAGTFDIFDPVSTAFTGIYNFNVPAVGLDELGGRCILMLDGAVLFVGDALNGAGAPVGSVLFQ